MKSYVAVLAASLFLLCSGSANGQNAVDPAQSSRWYDNPSPHWLARMENIKRNYRSCLKSEFSGIVESALGSVAQLGLALPESGYDGLKKDVARQSVAGATPAIRFKAYLTSLVLDNPEIFTREREMKFENPDDLFVALSDRLQKSLLGTNDR